MWEPLCADVGGIGCSWTCNHLQSDVDAVAALGLNAHGRIERRDDARRAMDTLDQLEGKEPGLWEAFLLVEYRSDSTGSSAAAH